MNISVFDRFSVNGDKNAWKGTRLFKQKRINVDRPQMFV